LRSLVKIIPTAAVAGAMALGALALSAPAASAAEYVCNARGDCWRVRNHYDYRPEWGLTVYDEAWYRTHRHDRHFRWRAEHRGRGYWHDGVWVRF